MKTFTRKVFVFFSLICLYSNSTTAQNDIHLSDIDSVIKTSHYNFVLLNISATWCAPCIQKTKSLINRKEEFDSLNIELIILVEQNSKQNLIDKYFGDNVRKFKLITKSNNPKKSLKEIGLELCPDLSSFHYEWPLGYYFLFDKNRRRILFHDPSNDETDIIYKIKNADIL